MSTLQSVEIQKARPRPRGAPRPSAKSAIWGYHATVVIGIRFAYGLRIAGPVLIGMSSIPGKRFALPNALGALPWACLIGGIGWIFGEAAEAFMEEVNNLEGSLLLDLVLIGIAPWCIANLRHHIQLQRKSPRSS
jgi:membrane protein DedA with SNARE-associated domain